MCPGERSHLRDSDVSSNFRNFIFDLYNAFARRTALLLMRQNPLGVRAQQLGSSALRMLVDDKTYATLLGVSPRNIVSTGVATRAPTWVDEIAVVCSGPRRAALTTMATRFGLSQAVLAALADAAPMQIRVASKVWLDCSPVALVVANTPDVVFRYPGAAVSTIARITKVFLAAGVLWARALIFSAVVVDLQSSMGCEKVQLDTAHFTYIPITCIESFTLLHHVCRLASGATQYDAAVHCTPAVRRFNTDAQPRRVIEHNAANLNYYVNRFVVGKRVEQQ